ncbi:hypothetical protein ACIQV3_23840 [Streptomyces sp. NPDC099050]|uniref:hypothetical protein n=1 Tax=Streptomyces sp. NPDC099050 TaxID=3366100 RepID=UPI003814B711
MGCEVSEIVKSPVFAVDGEPVAATCGGRQLSSEPTPSRGRALSPYRHASVNGFCGSPSGRCACSACRWPRWCRIRFAGDRIASYDSASPTGPATCERSSSCGPADQGFGGHAGAIHGVPVRYLNAIASITCR